MPASVPQRLLALYGFLLAHEVPVTRDAVRRGIEVYRDAASDAAFERMFERDKAALRELGLVVETVKREDVVAYRLDRDRSWMPEQEFSATERLLLGLASRMWEDPRAVRENEQTVRRLGVDPAADVVSGPGEQASGLSARLSAGGSVFEPAMDALAQGQRISFDYRAETGARTARRTVSPWGLGQRFGHWYLHGWDHDRGAPRTFRLSRAQNVRVLPEAGTVPHEPDFSMDRVLAAVGEAPVPESVVVFPARHLPVVLGWLESGTGLRAAGALEPVPAGTRAVDARGFPVRRDEDGASEKTDPTDAAQSARSAPEDQEPLAVRVAVTDPVEFLACLGELCGAAAAVAAAPGDVVMDSEAVRGRWARVRSLQDRVRNQYAAWGDAPLPPARRNRVRDASGQRFVRLVDLLGIVAEQPGIPVQDLARRLGVSGRQLRQDLEAVATAGDYLLGSADLRLESWDGEVRVQIVEGLARPVLVSTEHVLRLLLGIRMLAEVAPDLEPAARDLSAKLARTAPEPETVSQRVSVRVEDATSRLIERLREAASGGSAVRLEYRSRHAVRPSWRTVLPADVVSSGTGWVVEAVDLADGAHKTYRLEAVTALEEVAEESDASQGGARTGPTTMPAAHEEPRERPRRSMPKQATAGASRTTLLWVDAAAPWLVDALGAETISDVALPPSGGPSGSDPALEEETPGHVVRAEVYDEGALARFVLHHAGLIAAWGEGEWLLDYRCDLQE